MPWLSRMGRASLLLGTLLLAPPLSPSRVAIGGGGLWAEGLALKGLPAEAPLSLFDLSYGSAEAELLVKGSWTASLIGKAGLTLSNSGSLALADEQPLVFTQSPDLYISFLLFKKLFAEIRVSEDASASRYAVGYRGGEGEVLREVSLGNDGIDFPVLPFLSLGAGSYRSFGAAASIASGDFTGRAMVRYDQATRVERTFVGGAEVTETVVEASDFVRGRWFVVALALGESLANVEVYVENSTGALLGSDGIHYRKLEASEFTYGAATGLLSLAKKASTRVLAFATGVTSGVTVNGRACDLLYDPDNASAAVALGASTLVLSRYSLAGNEGSEAYVRDLATGLADTDYEVTVDASGFAQVSYSGVTDPQAADYRQPFATAMPWLYTVDLSSDSADTTYAPAYAKALVVRKYASSAKLSIDTDVIEGSVEVLRNGNPDYDFTVDATGGTITLGVSPGLDETIKVSYLRESATRSSGSLAAGLGGFFSPEGGPAYWAALGLRWSVPGTSYASAGQGDPGKVVLSLGESYQGGPWQESVALAAQWATEAASGRYRVEGMESSGTFKLSFRPLLGASDFEAVEVKEGSLATDWPTLASGLHADGSTQQALRLTADNSGTLILAKFLDTPPVSDYGTFSFYARASTSTTASTATLAVEVDQGTTATAELSLEIPVSALDTTWRRFSLHYGAGSLAVYTQAGEGGSPTLLGSAVASYDLSLSSASRLLVTLSGAQAGDILWLDEVLLDDASGQASLLAKGRVSYADKDLSVAGGLLRGLAAKADLSAVASESPSLSGGASLSTRILGLGLDLRALGGLSAAGGASLRGGHGLSYAGKGLSFSESFDRDPASGSFGRADSLRLDLGKVLSLSLSQGASFSGATAGSTGYFSQTWSASASLGTSLLRLGLEARSAGHPAGYAGLTAAYFEDWWSSLLLAAPAQEGSASLRSLTLTGSLGALAGESIASATATLGARPQDLSPTRSAELSLKVQLPLRLGEDLLLAPYYARTTTERRSGATSGLLPLAETALAEAWSNPVLWSSPPLAELFWSASTVASAYESYLASEGLSSARYAPELGLVLSRSFGSSPWDLLLPSALSLGYTRTFSLADSTFLSQGGFALSLKAQAVNVFGAAGTTPLLPFVESDEYRTSLKLTWARAEGDSQSSAYLVLQDLCTFYGPGSRDSLSLDNRLSWKTGPGVSAWTETLDASLSLRTDRGLLLDLYRAALAGALASDARKAAADAAEGGTDPAGGALPEASAPTRVSVVSSWLSSLAAAKPVARVIWGLTLDLDAESTDADPSYLDLSAEESLAWKLTLPDLLTLTLTAALAESRDGDTGLVEVAPSLSLEAKISF